MDERFDSPFPERANVASQASGISPPREISVDLHNLLIERSNPLLGWVSPLAEVGAPEGPAVALA